MIGNEVSIVGNLTRDPELRFTPSGQATVDIGIAVNRKWKNNRTDEWEEQVSFFNVRVWQTLAENVAETFQKGDRVVVTGRLEQRMWEKDGEKKSATDIVADEVSPSLRFATAQIVRNERTDGGAPPQRPATKAKAAPAYEYDEEPF
jgi:single-strand DNA-binding protein